MQKYKFKERKRFQEESTNDWLEAVNMIPQVVDLEVRTKLGEFRCDSYTKSGASNRHLELYKKGDFITFWSRDFVKATFEEAIIFKFKDGSFIEFWG